jgi:molybdopterin synthase catalytic subunit
MSDALLPPVAGDSWLSLTEAALPVAEVYEWCVHPSCGAVVLFSGTVRDHAEGRDDVTHLDYEAYTEQVLVTFEQIDAELRTRYPGVQRVALLHRVGRLLIEESSVVVAVSAPHRDEAFAAARFGIDTVKESAPIWKRESWQDGADWAHGAHDITPVGERR